MDLGHRDERVQNEDVDDLEEEGMPNVPRLAIRAAEANRRLVLNVAHEEQLDEEPLTLVAVLGMKTTIDGVIKAETHPGRTAGATG